MCNSSTAEDLSLSIVDLVFNPDPQNPHMYTHADHSGGTWQISTSRDGLWMDVRLPDPRVFIPLPPFPLPSLLPSWVFGSQMCVSAWSVRDPEGAVGTFGQVHPRFLPRGSIQIHIIRMLYRKFQIDGTELR